MDASNAFNSLNRQCALWNIRHLCPTLSTTLTNTYRASPALYHGEDKLLSEEGTTQGDPLAMSMYTLATRPLIDTLRLGNPSITQSWYADNACAAGSIVDLKKWWQVLISVGPALWLLCKCFEDLVVNKG